MREMIPQLREILDEFPEHVVIGGIAAALLGAPRTTVDVDVVLMLSPKEVDRIVNSFIDHGFHPGPDAATKLRDLQVNKPPNQSRQ